MTKYNVSIVKYEKPQESVKKAVELSNGLAGLKPGSKVFIKPNIVFWTKEVNFPKWGTITTSRIVEDMVIVLKEHGIDDITIGEGMVTLSPKDFENPAHAFKSLGYETLNKRYGVKYINVMERPFEKADLGDDISLNFNADILNSDFVVDLPVLKAHSQTVVSLGIKNLKGTIDIPSRKKCHSPDPEKNLNFMIARLADKMPPIFTLVDGIYSNERGPAYDGHMRRSNILIASSDILSADFIGAKVLGYEPADVPHLVHAAANHKRPLDLSDIEIVGEKIENVSCFHEFDYQYVQNEDNEWMPKALAKNGIKGVSYRKYDLSMCTYCSFLNGLILTAINMAWKGKPWDKVEILTGKTMKPTPGMNKTILMGKCMYKANKDHPDIKEMIPVKGCPPNPDDVVKALHQAGINADPSLFKNIEHLPGLFMARYKDKPEFDESFFTVKEI
ncbi:DUF362 [Desulfonema limicola]|uniref:DUF362 n=1 Tax=Desulfonema limicola TaxID=45656 RepID=A0A975BA68_9BACT|nr:DUF362 domain-containing protein [Desulfonema limicola]QTA81874.1 DUF362 [Desulfonema limicola]